MILLSAENRFPGADTTMYRRVGSCYAFGFSQLSTKYETTKPPAMRVVSNKVIQNNHHSFYNEGVQAIKIRKNGDYNG